MALTSAGGDAGENAWRGMLLGYPKPVSASEEDAPVFCNPATRCEYEEEEFHSRFAFIFAAAGLSVFCLATHFFRKDGVTKLTAVGGVAAAKEMGSSTARRWHYMCTWHALSVRVG